MFNQLCVITVCADNQCFALHSFVSRGPPDRQQRSGSDWVFRGRLFRFVVVFTGFIIDPHNQLLGQTNQMLSRYSQQQTHVKYVSMVTRERSSQDGASYQHATQHNINCKRAAFSVGLFCFNVNMVESSDNTPEIFQPSMRTKKIKYDQTLDKC